MANAGFHDVRFPANISQGATGGPRYRTTIVTQGNGVEARIPEWDEALLKWTVGHHLPTLEKLDEMLAFFHARMGSAYGFRFKDWSDYAVGLTWVMNRPVFDPAKAGTFAVYASGVTAYQLVKRYESGGTVRTRRITRPVAGTVKIYVGGAERTTGVSVDAATGVVTFSGSLPANGAVLSWTGEFDVPARFDADEMSVNMGAIQNGVWPSIGIVGIRK